MIAPTRRATALLLWGLPAAVLPAVVAPGLWVVWLAVVVASLALVWMDGLLALPPRRLETRVSSPELLYIGSEDPLRLDLDARGWEGGARITALAEVTGDVARPPAVVAALDGQGQAQAHIALKPLRRGRVTIDAVWLRWTGPFGLLWRTVRVPVARSIAVGPNVRSVRGAALRFVQNPHFMSGLKVQRYVGDGSEFESLREYLPGLDHRAIDWKASARHVRLLVREFRAERNHQIYLCFDTGRLMSDPLDGVPRLDHAINAGLLLGYLALKTGDRVGLFAFDERPRLYQAAQPGMAAFHRLQVHCSELDYGTAETNFTLGLTDLLGRLRRRSLVVVFTDFVDTVTADLMLDNVQRLARRHLVVFVSFRDLALDALVDADPRRLQDLSAAVVAADLRREREVVYRRLSRMGVHQVEAPTPSVPAQLINRYLEIKRRELV